MAKRGILTVLTLLWPVLWMLGPRCVFAAFGVEHSTEVRRLLAQVKEKERELNISWSGNQFLGHVGAKKFEAVFNRMYATDVKVNFTPGPSMTQMAGNLTQQAAAGQKASTDVFLGTESHFASLVNRDVLEGYDYALLSPRLTQRLVTPKGIGVEVASLVSGITYNTNSVSPADLPKRLEDVFKPAWKGKIASTQNASIFDRVAMRSEWGIEKMKAFVKRLSGHVGGLIRCGEPLRISSGEFMMMVLDCGGHDARRESAKGAPLGHIIPEDAATVAFLYMGVPKNSGHPNLAKLFINMAVSEEGQKVIYETDFTDHHELKNSQLVRHLGGLKSKGIEALRVDVGFALRHPEMRQLTQELTEILRQKRGE